MLVVVVAGVAPPTSLPTSPPCSYAPAMIVAKQYFIDFC